MYSWFDFLSLEHEQRTVVKKEGIFHFVIFSVNEIQVESFLGKSFAKILNILTNTSSTLMASNAFSNENTSKQ